MLQFRRMPALTIWSNLNDLNLIKWSRNQGDDKEANLFWLLMSASVRDICEYQVKEQLEDEEREGREEGRKTEW